MSREISSTADRTVSRTTRRSALAALGSAVVAGLAGCSGGSGTNAATTTATATPTATETATSTPSKLQQQLTTVKEATTKYATPKKALADGFKPGGPYVPGMGWHFSHPKRLKQAAKNGFSLEKPPLLTYVETDDGLQLGSVEFGAPAKAVSENPDIFADEEAETDATEKWHTHEAATHVFALPDDKQTSLKNVTLDQWLTNDHWTEFRPPDTDLSAGDTVSLNWGSAKGKEGDRTERIADLVQNHPSLRTLHVWVHAENPDGVFAPINPEYASGGGHDH